MKAKCKKCGGTVEVTRPKEYKTCKCGAIALDYGDPPYYYRVGGNPEDFDGEIEDVPVMHDGVVNISHPQDDATETVVRYTGLTYHEPTEEDNIKKENAEEWDAIEERVRLINKLIKEAGDHGSDGQGWYYTNKDGLEQAIKDYLEYEGLSNVTMLYWNDDDPLIVVNDCKCNGCLKRYLEKRWRK